MHLICIYKYIQAMGGTERQTHELLIGWLVVTLPNREVT